MHGRLLTTLITWWPHCYALTNIAFCTKASSPIGCPPASCDVKIGPSPEIMHCRTQTAIWNSPQTSPGPEHSRQCSFLHEQARVTVWWSPRHHWFPPILLNGNPSETSLDPSWLLFLRGPKTTKCCLIRTNGSCENTTSGFLKLTKEAESLLACEHPLRS